MYSQSAGRSRHKVSITTHVMSFVLALSGVFATAQLSAAGVEPLETDGVVHAFELPGENSGPTTLSIAADGTVWFTLGSGNAIGRINQDFSGYQEFALPQPDSSPHIIALGSDGNMWFSEHTGNRMGRITPAGAITEFDIP